MKHAVANLSKKNATPEQPAKNQFSTQLAEISAKRKKSIKHKPNNLELLIENTQECFLVIDANLEIVTVNDRLKQLYLDSFGIEIKKGKSILDYSVAARIEILKKILQNVFDGHAQESEVEIVGPDGVIINFLNKYLPVSDNDGKIIGAFISTCNITDTKNLSNSEEKYRSILENSMHAFFLSSPDGTILDANKTATAMFGYSLEELQQVGIEVIAHYSNQQLIEFLKITNELSHVKGELTGVKKDGEYFPCEFSSTNYKDNTGAIKCITFVSDISERKKIEQEGEKIKRHFRALVENTGDIIVLIDKEGTIMYVSPAFEKNTNFSSAEVINKNNLDFVHTDDLEDTKTRFQHILANPGVSVPSTNRIRIKNDGYIWVEGMITNLLEDENVRAIVSNYHDVTERNKSQEKIQNNEKRFRSLLQNSTDGLTLMDSQGIVLDISPTGKKITGYNHNDLVGQLRADLVHPDDLSTVNEAYLKVINNPDLVTHFDYRMLMPDGTYKWLENSCQNLLHDPTVEAIVLNYRDITDRKNQELEREKLIETLHQNNTDLKQFSYITSHNFKAPLSNLIGFLDLLKDMPIEDETLKKILSGFRVSTTLLNDTINDLIKILIIRDSDSIEQSKIYFNAIFEQASTQLQNLIEENQPEISIDFKDAPTVIFNNTYLESIFLNLLTNAIKFRSYARKLKIAVKTRETTEEVILSFSDNGIGIDIERHKAKIFGLYQCFHQRPNSKGLGLYLIKSQMESLGGTIEVESEMEVGTTFLLKFKKN